MNFLCISSYDNDLEWVGNYPNPHLIYDKTWNGGSYKDVVVKPSGLKEKYPHYNIVNASPNGYNIYDYMTFILDHYDNLPDVISFIKGNTAGRHVTQEFFDKIINSKCFCPIEEWTFHDLDQPALQNGYAMLSPDGGWMETNNSWYLNTSSHPSKYFRTYNEFMQFCFKNPVLPRYVRFAPGTNYVVPKEYILKYNKIFYENIRTFVSHSQLSGESHMIERALYTIWMCNFDVADTMKELVK
jgi:hypothetical protein